MPTTITTIRTVAVPASDQDRSSAFFVDQLGFERRMDAELAEGFRWIEVAPPGSEVSVAIVAASAALPAGIDTGIRFVTTDAEAEHASMERQGVDVDELLRWPGVPVMFSFRDPDGNTFYLAEPGA
jgi:catechol 2,3-dioxygenase-like lactoylglutathione lyase family enzyme